MAMEIQYGELSSSENVIQQKNGQNGQWCTHEVTSTFGVGV